MNKVYPSPAAALQDVLRDGVKLMIGGFGPCGLPENLIHAVLESGATDLTVISTDCGVPDYGVGKLITARRVRKLVAAYVGENQEFTRQLLSGEIEVELNPMGTLVERIRSGGAGIPAFYTKTGYGTKVAENKESRFFGSDGCLMERWLKADLALVKAHHADTKGNLVFNKTARNFNAVMPPAADVCIAEVEAIVDPGELDPDCIHTPAIYIDRIVLGTAYEKRIERRMTRARFP
jgi:3-oxoacid CoA-transferase subunit A